MDIKKLIQLQESKTVEFKRDTSSLEPILKCIVAFANTAGGIILVGIEDDGSVVGVDQPARIQEQLTNALVHANYEIPGTRIFVAIYEDKLEIQNPGVMPPGMSLEQFKAGVSRIRNPVIARVFGELGLVEEWGSGYKRIKEACQKGGYPEPQWEELGNVLRVTFYPHPEVIKEETGTKSGPR